MNRSKKINAKVSSLGLKFKKSQSFRGFGSIRYRIPSRYPIPNPPVNAHNPYHLFYLPIIFFIDTIDFKCLGFINQIKQRFFMGNGEIATDISLCLHCADKISKLVWFNRDFFIRAIDAKGFQPMGVNERRS